MESAIANVDLGRYRRIVQMFWDPEPANDATLDQPVWCLGCTYKLSDSSGQPADITADQVTHRPTSLVPRPPSPGEPTKNVSPPPANAPETPPESSSGSFSSPLAYDEPVQDGGGWPQGFHDDFASRFWMTYRSDFEPIPRSSDPKATSALSLSMRIKSQLVDQAGFSSDSGWGCMIRSGQSLLANAMAMLSLGRGKIDTTNTSGPKRVLILTPVYRLAPGKAAAGRASARHSVRR